MKVQTETDSLLTYKNINNTMSNLGSELGLIVVNRRYSWENKSSNMCNWARSEISWAAWRLDIDLVLRVTSGHFGDLESGFIFKFDCNTVIQNQNVENTCDLSHSIVYPAGKDHILIYCLKKKLKGTILCFSSILMAYYCFYDNFQQLCNSNTFFGPFRINGC